MQVTKLLISPVKKRIFCPKTTKFGPKLAFLVHLGQAMQAFSVSWWLWRAGCISQDTYLLYHNVYMFCTKPILSSVRTIHMQIAISKSDNESVEIELLLSADSDLLRFQKTGRSKLSHRSKKYRSSLTKCMTQNFRYFTSQQPKKCFICMCTL